MTRLGELLRAYQDRDPAARSRLEIFLLYPGAYTPSFFIGCPTGCGGITCVFWPGSTPRSPATAPALKSTRSQDRPPPSHRSRYGHCHRRDRPRWGTTCSFTTASPWGDGEGPWQAPPHHRQQCAYLHRSQGAWPLQGGRRGPHRRQRRGVGGGARKTPPPWASPPEWCGWPDRDPTSRKRWTRSTSPIRSRRSCKPSSHGWNFWRSSWRRRYRRSLRPPDQRRAIPETEDHPGGLRPPDRQGGTTNVFIQFCHA